MKRNRIVALLLTAAMMLGTTACGSSAPASSAVSASAGSSSAAVPDAAKAGQSLDKALTVGETNAQAVDGGTLIVSMPSSPLTLDPVNYSTLYENHIMYNVLETLFILDKDYKDIIPCLATDYTVSDDGLAYTVNLRDDVYFQDGQYCKGRKMTAQDVKYSLERSKTESATDRVCRDFFDYVEVVSDTQVILHMTSAAGPFLEQLALIGTAIVPKEEVEGWGEQFGNHIVGTGPFTLEKIVTDEKVILKKNDKYWGVMPHVDGLEFRIVSDSNQAFNAVQTGEVDIAMYLQGESIKRAQDTGMLLQTPASSVTYVRFNLQNGPTKEPKVREALTMATDIDSLVKGIYKYNEGTRAYQPLPAYSFAYDTKFNNLVPEYNIEKAKQLLAEAGYPNGFEMTLYIGATSNREKMAQMLQAYWKQIGVTLNIKSSTMAEWSAAVADSWNDSVVNSYGVSWNSTPDPYGFVDKFYNSNTIHASSNAGGYSDPEIDKLLNAAFALTDTAKRKEIYDQIMEKIMNEYTGIYYAYECRNWAVSSHVHDAILRADTQMIVASPFNNIWKDPA